MTQTTNPRIRQIAPGVQAEMIAEQTHFFYNPATGGGSISFQAREHLVVGSDVQVPMGDYSILEADVPSLLPRCFAPGATDPVTGADLSQVSSAGVMLILKAAYDTLYAEHATPEVPE